MRHAGCVEVRVHSPRRTAGAVPPCARTIPAARLLAPLPSVPPRPGRPGRGPASRSNQAHQPPRVPPPTTTASAGTAAASAMRSRPRRWHRLNSQSRQTSQPAPEGSHVRAVRERPAIQARARGVRRRADPLEVEVELADGVLTAGVVEEHRSAPSADGLYATNLPKDLGGQELHRRCSRCSCRSRVAARRTPWPG